MKGLLLKDLYMSLRYCRALIILVAVFLAVSFFSNDNYFLIIYPVTIAGVVPMSLISYDERDRWNQYSGTLPYSRQQLVSSKYLIGLVFGVAIYIVSFLAAIVRMTIIGNFSVNELLMTVMLLFIAGVICPTLTLPFMFKFGAEKGRIAFYIVVGIICACAVIIGMVFKSTVEVKSLWSLGAVCIIVIFLYILSWQLSIAFYKKREL